MAVISLLGAQERRRARVRPLAPAKRGVPTKVGVDPHRSVIAARVGLVPTAASMGDRRRPSHSCLSRRPNLPMGGAGPFRSPGGSTPTAPLISRDCRAGSWRVRSAYAHPGVLGPVESAPGRPRAL